MIRSFSGKSPRIADSAFVSEMAYVIGDVEIGENSTVWPGAVIRGDSVTIRIGNNTHIEDNCVVHAGRELTIGDNVSIGHGAIIHCNKIGNYVMVGNNATLLEGSEIGEYCAIGAGAVVPPRAKIPARSLAVGVPAQVIGEPSPVNLHYIEKIPEMYTELGRQFKEQGL